MTDWWTAWWEALATPDKVFWAIALVTSVILAIQILMTLFGFDGDADVDMDFDADLDGDIGHGDGVGLLSIRTVTAFFTGFGWGGILALDADFSVLGALLVGTATGGAMMGIVYGTLRTLYSMSYSGTLDYRNAIGAYGNVYLPIPPEMQGTGQIQVPVQGRLMTVQAMTRAQNRLPNQQRVKVVDVIDSQTLLVEPLSTGGNAPATAT